MFAEPLLLRLTSSMALLTLHFVIRPEWEYDVAFSPNGNPFKSQREISAVEEDLSSNYVIPILRLISDETRPANNVMSTTLFFAPNKKELHPFALRFGNVFIADDIHTNASFTVSFWCKHGFALGISIEFIDPMQTGTTPISVHKTIAAPAICDTSNNAAILLGPFIQHNGVERLQDNAQTYQKPFFGCIQNLTVITIESKSPPLTSNSRKLIDSWCRQVQVGPLIDSVSVPPFLRNARLATTTSKEESVERFQISIGPKGPVINLAAGRRRPLDPNHLSIKRENEYLSGLKIDEEQMQISVEQTTAGIHIENEEGIPLSQFSLKQIRDGKVFVASDDGGNGVIELSPAGAIDGTELTISSSFAGTRRSAEMKTDIQQSKSPLSPSKSIVTLHVSPVPIKLHLKANTGVRLYHQTSVPISSHNLSFTCNYQSVPIQYTIVDQPSFGVVECLRPQSQHNLREEFQLCSNFVQNEINEQRVRYRHTTNSRSKSASPPKTDSFAFQVLIFSAYAGDASSIVYVFHIDFMPTSIRLKLARPLFLNGSISAVLGTQNIQATSFPQNISSGTGLFTYTIVEAPKYGMLTRLLLTNNSDSSNTLRPRRQRRIGVSSNFTQEHIDQHLISYKLHSGDRPTTTLNDFFTFKLTEPFGISRSSDQLFRVEILYSPPQESFFDDSSLSFVKEKQVDQSPQEFFLTAEGGQKWQHIFTSTSDQDSIGQIDEQIDEKLTNAIVIFPDRNVVLKAAPGILVPIGGSHLNAASVHKTPAADEIVYKVVRQPMYGRLLCYFRVLDEKHTPSAQLYGPSIADAATNSASLLEYFTQADLNAHRLGYQSRRLNLGSWSLQDGFIFEIGIRDHLAGASAAAFPTNGPKEHHFRVEISYANIPTSSLSQFIHETPIYVSWNGSIAINSTHLNLTQLVHYCPDEELFVRLYRPPKRGWVEHVAERFPHWDVYQRTSKSLEENPFMSSSNSASSSMGRSKEEFKQESDDPDEDRESGLANRLSSGLHRWYNPIRENAFSSGQFLIYHHVVTGGDRLRFGEDEFVVSVAPGGRRTYHDVEAVGLLLPIRVVITNDRRLSLPVTIKEFRPQLSLVSGGSVQLKSTDFFAVQDQLDKSSSSQIVYNIVQKPETPHINLQIRLDTSHPISQVSQFTQEQINTGQVWFEHTPTNGDGNKPNEGEKNTHTNKSKSSPQFYLFGFKIGSTLHAEGENTAKNGIPISETVEWGRSRVLVVKIEPLALRLVNHSEISYDQGKTYVVLLNRHLGAETSGRTDGKNIYYNVTRRPTNGTFYWVDGENEAYAFTQQDIDQGRLLYAQLNMQSFQKFKDSFEFVLSNNEIELLPIRSHISVQSLVQPKKFLTESRAITQLSLVHLNATLLEGNSPRYIIERPPQYGRIFMVESAEGIGKQKRLNESASFFTHEDLKAGRIFFQSFETVVPLTDSIEMELRSDNVQPARFQWMIDIRPALEAGAKVGGITPEGSKVSLSDVGSIQTSTNDEGQAPPDMMNYQFPILILFGVVATVAVLLICRRSSSRSPSLSSDPDELGGVKKPKMLSRGSSEESRQQRLRRLFLLPIDLDKAAPNTASSTTVGVSNKRSNIKQSSSATGLSGRSSSACWTPVANGIAAKNPTTALSPIFPRTSLLTVGRDDNNRHQQQALSRELLNNANLYAVSPARSDQSVKSARSVYDNNQATGIEQNAADMVSKLIFTNTARGINGHINGNYESFDYKCRMEESNDWQLTAREQRSGATSILSPMTVPTTSVSFATLAPKYYQDPNNDTQYSNNNCLKKIGVDRETLIQSQSAIRRPSIRMAAPSSAADIFSPGQLQQPNKVVTIQSPTAVPRSTRWAQPAAGRRGSEMVAPLRKIGEQKATIVLPPRHSLQSTGNVTGNVYRQQQLTAEPVTSHQELDGQNDPRKSFLVPLKKPNVTWKPSVVEGDNASSGIATGTILIPSNATDEWKKRTSIYAAKVADEIVEAVKRHPIVEPNFGVDRGLKKGEQDPLQDDKATQKLDEGKDERRVSVESGITPTAPLRKNEFWV